MMNTIYHRALQFITVVSQETIKAEEQIDRLDRLSSLGHATSLKNATEIACYKSKFSNSYFSDWNREKTFWGWGPLPQKGKKCVILKNELELKQLDAVLLCSGFNPPLKPLWICARKLGFACANPIPVLPATFLPAWFADLGAWRAMHRSDSRGPNHCTAFDALHVFKACARWAQLFLTLCFCGVPF